MSWSAYCLCWTNGITIGSSEGRYAHVAVVRLDWISSQLHSFGDNMIQRISRRCAATAVGAGSDCPSWSPTLVRVLQVIFTLHNDQHWSSNHGVVFCASQQTILVGSDCILETQDVPRETLPRPLLRDSVSFGVSRTAHGADLRASHFLLSLSSSQLCSRTTDASPGSRSLYCQLNTSRSIGPTVLSDSSLV